MLEFDPDHHSLGVVPSFSTCVSNVLTLRIVPFYTSFPQQVSTI